MGYPYELDSTGLNSVGLREIAGNTMSVNLLCALYVLLHCVVNFHIDIDGPSSVPPGPLASRVCHHDISAHPNSPLSACTRAPMPGQGHEASTARKSRLVSSWDLPLCPPRPRCAVQRPLEFTEFQKSINLLLDSFGLKRLMKGGFTGAANSLASSYFETTLSIVDASNVKKRRQHRTHLRIVWDFLFELLGEDRLVHSIHLRSAGPDQAVQLIQSFADSEDIFLFAVPRDEPDAPQSHPEEALGFLWCEEQGGPSMLGPLRFDWILGGWDKPRTGGPHQVALKRGDRLAGRYTAADCSSHAVSVMGPGVLRCFRAFEPVVLVQISMLPKDYDSAFCDWEWQKIFSESRLVDSPGDKSDSASPMKRGSPAGAASPSASSSGKRPRTAAAASGVHVDLACMPDSDDELFEECVG